jgi:hypothetical protein
VLAVQTRVHEMAIEETFAEMSEEIHDADAGAGSDEPDLLSPPGTESQRARHKLHGPPGAPVIKDSVGSR